MPLDFGLGETPIDASLMSGAAIRPQPKRPVAVAGIALLQILRSLVMLGLIFWLVTFPADDLLHRVEVRAVALLSAGYPMSNDTTTLVLMGAYALLMMVVGAGVWMMKKWASVTLAVLSGLTVAYWTMQLFFTAAFGGSVARGDAERQSIYALMLLDVVIWAYLMYESAVFDEVA